MSFPMIPSVRLTESGLVTTSRDVADAFGKQHQHVLRDIDALIKSLNSLRPNVDAPAFEAILGEPDLSGYAPRHYEMGKDAFTLLVMGYTGPKALRFKLAYIARFNEMQAILDRSINDESLAARRLAAREQQLKLKTQRENRLQAREVRLQQQALTKAKRTKPAVLLTTDPTLAQYFEYQG